MGNAEGQTSEDNNLTLRFTRGERTTHEAFRKDIEKWTKLTQIASALPS
ncbi:unnamed protein product, partial [marine sediment metagenome]